MTDVALRLKDELLRLPEEDRRELARILYDSVEEEIEGVDFEAEWIEELNHRAADLDAGRAMAEPADKVMAELREEAMRELRS